jgi:hypothetical protein
MGKKIAYLFAFLTFAILLVFTSCNKQDTEAKVPAYIQIDSVACNFLPSQGTNRHNITDVWVNIEGEYVGTFSVPARFPVIATGSKNVSIYPVIKINGITDVRDEHPFMNKYSTEVQFESLEVHKISPVFDYKEKVDVWLEDFEDAGHNFFTNDSIDFLFQIQDPDNDGNHIGLVNIPTGTTGYYDFFTKEKIRPLNGIAFLEFDYRCNAPFGIGIRVLQQDDEYKYIDPFIEINAKNEWNKIYINLGEQFVYAGAGKAYDVFFVFAPVEDEETKVYFDNFKILEFSNQ